MLDGGGDERFSPRCATVVGAKAFYAIGNCHVVTALGAYQYQHCRKKHRRSWSLLFRTPRGRYVSLSGTGVHIRQYRTPTVDKSRMLAQAGFPTEETRLYLVYNTGTKTASVFITFR